jgi:hypothetical protein
MNEYDVEKFSYDTVPLDPSMDSIRLLALLPAKEGGAICCRLTTKKFAQRPKYEALSYRWGSTSEKNQYAISVNKKSLSVGKNLFHALKNLRYEKNERILWADAICINQSDLDERNSQVAMMSWIYSRAQRVLVWLGQPLEEGGSGSARWLVTSEYWKRVWIIQEIVLARRLLICYQKSTIEWKNFIREVKVTVVGENSLPYKINGQLEGKYKNEHGLQELIESHADQLCKDPRDHIYGFVGLANDCHDGFPMDYQKSLYEVWKDVVAFKVSKGWYAHDVMKFGKTVYDLLGGKAMSENRNVLPADPLAMKFKISSRVAGKIVHLGPPFEEAISTYKEVANWKASINRSLPEDRRASAREESELFLETLERVETKDLEFVFGFDRDISWKAEQTPEAINLSLGIDEKYLSSQSLDSSSESCPKMPRLFLMGGTPLSYRPPYYVHPRYPGAVGLAPPAAQVGDYICQIHGLKEAVIVRRLQFSKYFAIIGTAGLAQNRSDARTARDHNAGRIFTEANFSRLDMIDDFELLVDMPFSYSLLEGKEMDLGRGGSEGPWPLSLSNAQKQIAWPFQKMGLIG